MTHAAPSPGPAGTNPVSQFISGRRTSWFVALVPLLLALAVLGMVGEGDRDAQPTDSLPEGYDSTTAVGLQQELPEEDSSVAIVLWTAEDGELSTEQVGAVSEQAGELLADAGDGGSNQGPPEGVEGGQGGPEQDGEGPGSGPGEGGPEASGPEDSGPVQLAEDGTAAFVVVPV